MRIHLVISSWMVTVLIAVLGLYAGQTIWFYQEPVLDAVSTPQSYFIAAYSGIAVLTLSFTQSVVMSINYATKKAAPASSDTESR